MSDFHLQLVFVLVLLTAVRQLFPMLLSGRPFTRTDVDDDEEHDAMGKACGFVLRILKGRPFFSGALSPAVERKKR